ncbi:DUF4382 domain-containing protein [Marinitoga aeolica]|uniref:DUF4382 domain-containing protein n=1 Tax=Marinitoga aeolica TaxID=2809031 RepID=A0ABY8PQP7_9BACT|nr:DUF4382 domain-containing protein [Marinitoga aeolica]WGS64936.1 DUF4382 domain-containing protein [Marinitoga aeolica]
MSKKRIFFISFLLLILSFSLVGCFSEKVPSATKNVSLDVLLTDRPVSDIDELHVFIKDIYFTYELNGESFESTPVTINKDYDILSLAGTEVTLFSLDIPEGSELGTIHMDVEQEATVIITNNNYTATVAANGKLVIPNAGIDVNADGELVIDFDAASSLKQIGNTNNYKLIPVLKPSFRRKNSTDIFAIKGKVLDVSENPVSKAIITLSATITNEPTIIRVSLTNKDGEFYLGKHENGKYDINLYTNVILPEDGEINFDSLASDYSTTLYINSEDVNITINLNQ